MIECVVYLVSGIVVGYYLAGWLDDGHNRTVSWDADGDIDYELYPVESVKTPDEDPRE